MEQIKFGTDGIRARVGTGIHPAMVVKLGWAVGEVLKQKKTTTGTAIKVLIAKDTRISGYMIESALEAGLVSTGAHIYLLGPMPTPAVPYLTRSFGADLGIVISASHNPYEDNGIKFFTDKGAKLPAQLERAIEKKYQSRMSCVPSRLLGKAYRIDDAPGRYIEFCKNSLANPLRLQGMHIVIDCANGATYHIAPSVFEELGAKVTVIHASPNGLNINQKCGSTYTHPLKQAVLATKADIGIALDGDGDRVILIDQRGQRVDGDDMLYILAKYRIASGALPGGVVGTLMSNLGLHHALDTIRIPFARAPVGDKHVLSHLHQKDWWLGGEPSGHLILRKKNTCGDGIIAALHILSIMQQTQDPLHVLYHELSKCPQHHINVNVPQHEIVCQQQPIQAAIRQFSAQLGEQGRILLRPSGTEPLIRIMVEGRCQHTIQFVAEKLANIVLECSGTA